MTLLSLLQWFHNTTNNNNNSSTTGSTTSSSCRTNRPVLINRNEYTVVPEFKNSYSNQNKNDTTSNCNNSNSSNSYSKNINSDNNKNKMNTCYTIIVHCYYSLMKRRKTTLFAFSCCCCIITIVLFVFVTNPSTTITPITSSIGTTTGNTNNNNVQQEQNHQQHKEMIPTILSIIDIQTNNFIYALDNPIYDMIQQQTILLGTTNTIHTTTHSTTGSSSFVLPKITLNKNIFFESNTFTSYPSNDNDKNNTKYNNDLLISWTNGINENGMSYITNNDLLVLHCTRSTNTINFSNTSSDWDIIEVATIEQVKVTNTVTTITNRSSNVPTYDDDTNVWYIPNFPRLRYSICLFALYQQHEQIEQEQEEMIITTSSIGNSNNNNTSNNFNNKLNYNLVAISELLHLKNSMTIPNSIHLAVGTDPSQMVVNFITGIVGIPIVEYWLPIDNDYYSDNGTVNNNSSTGRQNVTGTNDTYTTDDLCQEPATVFGPGKFTHPGQLHSVIINKLVPNTKYMYRVGIIVLSEEEHEQHQEQQRQQQQQENSIFWRNDVYNFISTIPIGYIEQPISYIVYGDQGCPSTGWDDGSLYVKSMTQREIIRNQQQNHTTSTTTTTTTISSTNTSSSNTNNNNHNIIIRAVHHIGDLSYAQGAGHQWDNWFTMIESFTPYVPLMIGIGNHEYDYTSGGLYNKDLSSSTTTSVDSGFMPVWGNFANDSGGECGVPTSKRFAMPQQIQRTIFISHNNNDANNTTSTTTVTIPPSNGVYWYSYDTGIVHTIVISSEHNLSSGSVQHTWLQNELQYNINRTITPWIIIETHRPLYEGENKSLSNIVSIHMRNEFEDLLYQNNVDIVFSGHYHAYHRTCDKLYRSICDYNSNTNTNSTNYNNNDENIIYNSNNDGSGPIHITVGTAGAHLDDSNLFDNNNWTEMYIMGENGYGRVTVYNASTLHFEFIKSTLYYNTNTEYDDDNENNNLVLDDVWIIRER